jgi:hypothetical protein
MPPAGFEPTILASERPKTHALDRAAAGIDLVIIKISTNVQIMSNITRHWKEIQYLILQDVNIILISVITFCPTPKTKVF